MEQNRVRGSPSQKQYWQKTQKARQDIPTELYLLCLTFIKQYYPVSRPVFCHTSLRAAVCWAAVGEAAFT